MAFMDMFKKKKKEAPPPLDLGPEMPMPPAGPPPQMRAPPPTAGASLPIDQVSSMMDQGMSNEEIISSLQAQGFNAKQIYDAIAQVEAGPPGAPIGPGVPPEMPPPHLAKPVAPAGFEEMAESIIEEKWVELTKEFGKINEWKEINESRISKIEQSVADMKSDLDNLHKAIVSKIGDYDKNLLDVGTEIKAMEKVFQKVLPELTSSVQELGRITKTAKAKKKVVKRG